MVAFSNQQKKAWLITIVVVLLSSAVGQYLPILLTPLSRLENDLSDIRFVVLAQKPELQNQDIVIVGITDEDLEQLSYRSPVDREFLSGILGPVINAAPKAIFLDMLFDRATEPGKDAQLVQLLAETDIPTFISYGGPASGVSTRQQAFIQEFARLTGSNTVWANLAKSSDSVVRRLGLEAGPERNQATVPAAIAAMINELDDAPVKHGDPLLYLPDTLDGNPPFPIYPAGAVPFLPPEFFADKIVFFGATLPDVDVHRTPFAVYDTIEGFVAQGNKEEQRLDAFGPNMPGVVIHAHQLAQLISDNYVNNPPSMAIFAFLFVLAALSGRLIIASEIGSWRFLLPVTLAFIWFIAAFYAYFAWRLLVPIVPPVLTLIISSLILAFYGTWEYQRRSSSIQGAFSKFLDPTVVKQLVDEPWRVSTFGERKLLSVVFTDIAGFTTISEKADAAKLVAALNQYLDGMVKLIGDHQGTVDKFIGDATVSFFNAPLDQEDHADRAIRLIIDMARFAKEMQQVEVEPDLYLGATRIGLHTGEASVGNIGGEQKFEYTAIGDTINTAARLEGLNKYIGTDLCFSGDVVSNLSDTLKSSLDIRLVGNFVLKGRSHILPVYTCPTDADWADQVAYNQVLELVEHQSENAGNAVEALLAQYPSDPLLRFHSKRLKDGVIGVEVIMADK